MAFRSIFMKIISCIPLQILGYFINSEMNYILLTFYCVNIASCKRFYSFTPCLAAQQDTLLYN